MQSAYRPCSKLTDSKSALNSPPNKQKNKKEKSSPISLGGYVGASIKFTALHETWLERRKGAGTTCRSHNRFLSETSTSAGGMKKEPSSACCSGGTRNTGSSLFRTAGFKPVSPLASQGHSTRRPLNSLRGDFFQLSRWSGALAWPKSPRFKGLERASKEDCRALILVKHYGRWLKDPLLVSVVEAVCHTSQTSLRGGYV